MADDEKQPTPEEVAAKVARALLRIPAPEKAPRRKAQKRRTTKR